MREPKALLFGIRKEYYPYFDFMTFGMLPKDTRMEGLWLRS